MLRGTVGDKLLRTIVRHSKVVLQVLLLLVRCDNDNFWNLAPVIGVELQSCV